ncbi:T9SS type A sorting domain-containing protein [bacterium]|nr:T9SS type A sorting domain-containing protein [bacterium]NIN93288.1 T9SS type A sorting domain-containing protein [bacterium]NIO19083.1 T9SS type A sorting domain-containing protein [bacterium]NIO74214.1 T9SS type A sorting domain-containing protein [bacterium]
MRKKNNIIFLLLIFGISLIGAKHLLGADIIYAVRIISDSTPPAAITTLSVSTGANKGEINLSWLAPGDDGTSGTIENGEFRIQSSTWSGVFWSTTKAEVSISASSVSPGSVKSYVFSNLIPGVTYYFKIWTRDENPDNWSPESNIASAKAQINPAYTGYTLEVNTAEGIRITIEVPDTAFAISTQIEVRLVDSSHPKFYLVREADRKTGNFPVTHPYEFIIRDLQGNILGEDDFHDKIRITFTYPQWLNLAQQNPLRIFRLNETVRKWEEQKGHTVDVFANTIGIDAVNFSIYKVMIKINSGLDDLIVYPNPFKVKEAKDGCVKFINLPKNVTLRIYNIAGEMVYKKVYDNTGGGITWDGKNDSKRTVATGVYIYLLKDDNGNKKTGKISVIQ